MSGGVGFAPLAHGHAEALLEHALGMKLEAYRANPGPKKEVEGLNKALDVLVRNKVLPESAKVK